MFVGRSSRAALSLRFAPHTLAVIAILFLAFSAHARGMSLDRLGIDQNELLPQAADSKQPSGSNDESILVDDRELEAVPHGGNTDMYVLVPGGGAHERENVDKNTIEQPHQHEMDPANGESGDMLMMESSDAPVVQMLVAPVLEHSEHNDADNVGHGEDIKVLAEGQVVADTKEQEEKQQEQEHEQEQEQHEKTEEQPEPLKEQDEVKPSAEDETRDDAAQPVLIDKVEDVLPLEVSLEKDSAQDTAEALPAPTDDSTSSMEDTREDETVVDMIDDVVEQMEGDNSGSSADTTQEVEAGESQSPSQSEKVPSTGVLEKNDDEKAEAIESLTAIEEDIFPEQSAAVTNPSEESEKSEEKIENESDSVSEQQLNENENLVEEKPAESESAPLTDTPKPVENLETVLVEETQNENEKVEKLDIEEAAPQSAEVEHEVTPQVAVQQELATDAEKEMAEEEMDNQGEESEVQEMFLLPVEHQELVEKTDEEHKEEEEIHPQETEENQDEEKKEQAENVNEDEETKEQAESVSVSETEEEKQEEMEAAEENHQIVQKDEAEQAQEEEHKPEVEQEEESKPVEEQMQAEVIKSEEEKLEENHEDKTEEQNIEQHHDKEKEEVAHEPQEVIAPSEIQNTIAISEEEVATPEEIKAPEETKEDQKPEESAVEPIAAESENTEEIQLTEETAESNEKPAQVASDENQSLSEVQTAEEIAENIVLPSETENVNSEAQEVKPSMEIDETVHVAEELEDANASLEPNTLLTTIIQVPQQQQPEQPPQPVQQTEEKEPEHHEQPPQPPQLQYGGQDSEDDGEVPAWQQQLLVQKQQQALLQQQLQQQQLQLQQLQQQIKPIAPVKIESPTKQQQQHVTAIASGTQQQSQNVMMDSVLNYVNASFMQHNKKQEQPNPQQDEVQTDFNAKERRYDGAQVWRIVVQNDHDRKLADELQTKYDGQLWKEVKQEVDYLLKPQVLADAAKHLRAANLSRIVLIDNLQNAIETENPPANEIALLQNRKGHRLTWQAYHRLDDIHGFFDYLAKTYPDICAVETIGYSLQKRPLKILKISNGNAGNPGFWIDGGMHAREWISPASVTYIANQLVEGWDDLPDYMRNINWYIHPVANPDGYEYSHTTDRLWRKNLRSHGRQCPGVDLNRNFGYKWGGKGTSANPCSQTYRGSKAFSEPETFYISKFISNYPRDTFKAYLSFHSYGQYILYPWGYDYHLTTDKADLDRVARQAGSIITKKSGMKYTVGSSATTLYPAAGGSDDWAKGFAGIKYTYTVEMGDTGRFGFILPASHIEPNGKDGYTFVETVARAVTQSKENRKRKHFS